MGLTPAIIVTSLVLGAGASGVARAQDDHAARDARRFVPHLHVGFGGSIELEGLGIFAGTEADLDPTIGIGLRLEVPLHEYVLMGGFLMISFWEIDGVDVDRNNLFDFDLLIGGRYTFDVGHGLEVRLLLPVGFTLSLLDNDVETHANAGPGWNVGFWFGAMYPVHERVGLLLELGMLHHGANHEGEGGRPDADGRMIQGTFNLGAAVLL